MMKSTIRQLVLPLISGGEYPERAECDFSTPGSYDHRSRTQCASCGKVWLLSEAFVLTKKIGGEELVEHFCPEDQGGHVCASEFYLERLRGEGL